MFNPSPEYSQSRPFKIFISLLDRWEIGLPLTEVLVYDAFRALRKALDSGSDVGDDVRYCVFNHQISSLTINVSQLTMTGSTLYEAVDQYALWNRLLVAIMADFDDSSSHREVRLDGAPFERILMSACRVVRWSNTFLPLSILMTRRSRLFTFPSSSMRFWDNSECDHIPLHVMDIYIDVF